jgi:hypothetical protein
MKLKQEARGDFYQRTIHLGKETTKVFGRGDKQICLRDEITH